MSALSAQKSSLSLSPYVLLSDLWTLIMNCLKLSISPSHLTPMPLTISDLIPAHLVPELKHLTKSPNHYSTELPVNIPWNSNPSFIDPSIPLLFQLELMIQCIIKQRCRQLCLDFSNLKSVIELLMIFPPLLVLKPSRSIAMLWFWSLLFSADTVNLKILINCLKIKLFDIVWT